MVSAPMRFQITGGAGILFVALSFLAAGINVLPPAYDGHPNAPSAGGLQQETDPFGKCLGKIGRECVCSLTLTRTK